MFFFLNFPQVLDERRQNKINWSYFLQHLCSAFLSNVIQVSYIYVRHTRTCARTIGVKVEDKDIIFITVWCFICQFKLQRLNPQQSLIIFYLILPFIVQQQSLSLVGPYQRWLGEFSHFRSSAHCFRSKYVSISVHTYMQLAFSSLKTTDASKLWVGNFPFLLHLSVANIFLYMLKRTFHVVAYFW